MGAKSLFVAEHPKEIVTIGADIYVNTGRDLGSELPHAGFSGASRTTSTVCRQHVQVTSPNEILGPPNEPVSGCRQNRSDGGLSPTVWH